MNIPGTIKRRPAAIANLYEQSVPVKVALVIGGFALYSLAVVPLVAAVGVGIVALSPLPVSQS